MESHYFLALPLPEENKQMIARWREEAKRHLSFKKWVHKQDYHITLFFLGTARTSQLNSLTESMHQLTETTKPFIVSGGGIGYFGKAANPKILWAGVDTVYPLTAIQKKISAVCVQNDFMAENRKYYPHITVARKWQGETSFRDEIENVPALASFNWKVDNVILLKTHLNKEPKYERVESFSLRADT